MTFCSSSKVAVFSLLTIDVDLCLNMSEDLNQIYCRRSLDMNSKEAIEQSKRAIEKSEEAIKQSKKEQQIRDIEKRLELFYVPAENIMKVAVSYTHLRAHE